MPKNFQTTMYHFVGFEDSAGYHTCDGLVELNVIRKAIGENQIFIYEDFDTCEFNIKLGLEFIAVQYCPFCGVQLCEEK